MRYFKFNFTPLRVILHIYMVIFTDISCCHGNLSLRMCCEMEKLRDLHIWHDIGLSLLKSGTREYFWILNTKAGIKLLYDDVILTLKRRKGKIPIYS